MTSQAAPGMVTPSGVAYGIRRFRTCLVSSAACAGLSPARISVAARGGTLVLQHVVYVAADGHRLVRLLALDAAEPRAAQQRAHLAGAGEAKAADGPGGSPKPSMAAVRANPKVKMGFSSRVRQHKNASPPPRRSAFLRLPNAAAGSSKSITPKLAQHHVEDPGPERVHLDVGDLEPGVSGASSSGEPARFRHQDPEKSAPRT